MIDQYIDAEVAGILIPRMKVMPAKYKGKCQRSGTWFDPSKNPCMIAFKHRDHLTDNQIEVLYGNHPVYHVTVLLNPQELASLDLSPSNIPIVKKDFVPSSYQSNILDKLLNTENHLFIEALAGCGKTQTLVWVVQELTHRGLAAGKRIVYLAFNKSIQEELSKKLIGTNCPAMTTHSFGFQALKGSFKELEKAGKQALSNSKTTDLFIQILAIDLFHDLSNIALKKVKKTDHYKLKSIISGSRGLVGFIKNWGIVPSYNPTSGAYEFSDLQKDQIKSLIEKYQLSIPTGFEKDHVVEYACRVTIAGIPLPGDTLTRISFDDMLYLPLALKLPLPKYDLAMVDESQDMNEVQEQMLFQMAKDGARIVAIGDNNQSIYAFRGSDTQAFQKIKVGLSQTQRNVITCDLPVNYRCDEAIINHARQWVPGLQGRGIALGQQKGEVTHNTTYSQALQTVNNSGVEEFAFLCRINVPLVVTAYQLIAQGKRCCIVGRQAIASPMIAIIDDLCGFEDKFGNVPEYYTDSVLDKKDNNGRVVEEGLLTRLNHHYTSQIAKLSDEKHEQALEDLTNNVDCIEIIAGRVKNNSVKSVIKEIESLFTEKPDDKGTIVLSTVHRAKGLEWDNVYILCPHLMPHPNVKANPDGSWSEEQQQEQNCQYIACTRARHKLHYICNWPFGRGKGTRLTHIPEMEVQEEYDRHLKEAYEESLWERPAPELVHDENLHKAMKDVKEFSKPENIVDNGEPF